MVLGVWLALLGCLLVGAPLHAAVLTQAHATVTVGGVVTRQDVQLPYHWDRVHRGKEGEPERERLVTHGLFRFTQSGAQADTQEAGNQGNIRHIKVSDCSGVIRSGGKPAR